MNYATFGASFFPHDPERVAGGRVGSGTGGLRRKKYAMAQQIQHWRSGKAEMAWLSTLVETMEKVSRAEFRGVPCDHTALKAHLARPALPPGFYGSNFSLRN